MMKNSTKVLSDPFIVPRVKQYLEENVHQTYVDVAVMARQLQKRYNEYNKRQTEPFLQLVEEAYRIVVQSYGLDIDSSSESGQSDIEMVEEDDSSNKSMNMMNNMVTKLYEKSGTKKDSSISNASKEQSPEEKGPINISSDEDENESNKHSTTSKPSASIAKVVGSTTIKPLKSKDDKPQLQQPLEQQSQQSQTQLENQSKVQPAQPQILQCIPQKQLLQASQAREQMPRLQYRLQRFPKSSAENSVKSSNRLLKKRPSNDEAQSPVTNNSNNNNNKFGPKKKEKDRNYSRVADGRKIAMLVVSKIDLTNIGGIDEKLIKLCEILFNIKHSHIYKHIGLKPPKGILIHGPPGCGKTMLAMGIAGTLKYPIISCNATEFIAGVSGESEERIRNIFEQAIEIGDCIVLIDNIDVIGTNQAYAEKEMSRRVVSQLISCLDNLNSLEEGENIVVVGITRKPEIIDPGLTGDGRFDFEISLGIPDRKQRTDIMRVICENIRLEENFNYDKIAKLTPGYVGGDLKSLVKKACSIVVRRRYIEEIKSLQAAHNKNIPTIDLDGGDETMRETAEKNDENTNVADIPEAASSNLNVTDPIESFSKKARLEEEFITDNTVDADQEISESKTNGANDENIQEPENELSEAIQVSTEDDKDENMNVDINVDINVDMNVDINVDINDQNSVNGLQINEKSNTELLETETETASVAADELLTASELKNKEISSELSNCSSASEPSEKEKLSSSSSQSVSESSSHGFSSKPKVRLLEMINLLNDEDVLTESILDRMSVGMDDFEEALKDTKPAALREGFLTVPDVTWNDIGSLHSIREELQLAIFTQVKYPEKLQALGITMPAGVLLCGPPGCGKTLLAKAIANEAGINFISVKGPELLNMYVGESERAVRTCFQRARNSAPCVVFFDEFDALCPRRSKSSESYQSRIVNQLLTEMDGVESRKGVYLLAATNRPDILDPAVLRPGRLETILYVGLPNDSDREQILFALSKNGTKPSFNDDVKLSEISLLTDGFSGADLAGLLRQASYLALNFALKNPEEEENNLKVRRQDFLDALKLIKPSVTPEDRLMYLKLRDQYAAPRELQMQSN